MGWAQRTHQALSNGEADDGFAEFTIGPAKGRTRWPTQLHPPLTLLDARIGIAAAASVPYPAY
jgi:hypothetical protein